MKKILLSLFILFTYGSTIGQSCNCLENFNYVENKIKNNYAGFTIKVNNENIKEYINYTEFYREGASKITTTQRCVLHIEEWLKFFNDKHLQLSVTKNIYFTFKQIDSLTILFRIPNFAWTSKPIIDSLIRTNYELIRSTPNLIIDLRGNGGGIDYSYLELLPLIYTHPYESKGIGYWASKGNIEYFEKALKEGNIKSGKEEELKDLIYTLKTKPNTFVSLRKNNIIQRDTVYEFPQKVGIIVNDYCASSCEQFILAGKNSSKTTVFGTNTLGVLDYSNAAPVELPLKNIQLYYPMSRSFRLPEYPIDNVGIEPDIRIYLPENLDLKAEVDEWVFFVKDYLEKDLQLNKY